MIINNNNKKNHNIKNLLLWQHEKVPLHQNKSNQMEKKKIFRLKGKA
jgi:hypothetical protein